MSTLTPELEAFIENKLGNKLWRLDNLYHIIDKNGKKGLLRLNPSQRKVLTEYNHTKKIILKSRQQGISTLYVAYNLDSCLFNSNYSAGVQSYGKDEGKKLQYKARLMWEELDPDIKKLLGIDLVIDNQNGMQFSNGSILKIGNFRGDTLQSLHVSELAKIAKRYPEKAHELKTGAFQAIGQNNRITIESTAEGKSGLFYEMWAKALAKEKALRETNTPYSPFDFQSIFLSWLIDPDCYIQTPVSVPKEIDDYLDKIEEEEDVTITKEQRWWYAAKAEELGPDMKQEYPTTADEAFMQPVEGTYYHHEYKTLHIASIPHNPRHVVHMACDLGMNDTFSIGFFQVDVNGHINIIGEHLDHSLLLEDYKDACDAKAKANGWTLGYIYCPHDVMVRELGAGQRIQTMRKLGFNPLRVKRLPLLDGIQITREMLKSCTIDPSCIAVISAIQNYRKKYDEKYQVFLDKPVHDEFSHTADMLRYLAVGMKLNAPQKNTIAQFATPKLQTTQDYYIPYGSLDL